MRLGAASDAAGSFSNVTASATDSASTRKERGAFFTPPSIAAFLTRWAIRTADDCVMDPTCGEAAFLLAAAERLRGLGASHEMIASQLTGVDRHQPSLDASAATLAEDDYRARLIHTDFFDLVTPAQFGDQVGWQDAVVGNPPFVRYQDHWGSDRKRSAAAALAQGVRLSGLASSWAATIVHASAFLKPTGRLAIVLPAELLTVGYAEPLRRWLRRRFGAVNLFMFEQLQFADADEHVVLLVAQGPGPCDSFGLYQLDDAEDLAELHPADNVGANPAAEGKWSDLVLPLDMRRLFKSVAVERMARLDTYGRPELGTVTGANNYFALSDMTRRKYGLSETHLKKISPPGTRHLKGLSFTRAQWEVLRLKGERVWLFHPQPKSKSKGLAKYIAHGEELGVSSAYKCTIRNPWWRPPAVPTPDLFFTYMSHRYPRLIANTARVTFLNSMHGLKLCADAPNETRQALPLLALNSATMLGAEIMGRSYGGGILKMEPREAAGLPVPAPAELCSAWKALTDRRADLDAALRRGEWWTVVAEIDRVVLKDAMKLDNEQVGAIRDAAALLRIRRTRQTEPDGSVAKA
jgi:adenine-specific DNA-methyltransferase